MFFLSTSLAAANFTFFPAEVCARALSIVRLCPHAWTTSTTRVRSRFVAAVHSRLPEASIHCILLLISVFCPAVHLSASVAQCLSPPLAQCGLVLVPYVAAMLNSGPTLEWMCCWRPLSLGWQPLRANGSVDENTIMPGRHHPLMSTVNTSPAHIPAFHAAGGEPPLLMHSGATHPCTNSAARAAGGESPPLRAHLGHSHPAQVPQLERPRRAYPPVLPHMLNAVLDTSIAVCRITLTNI